MTQRVALVTGAMGGLGTSICQELAKAGHKVVAAYHPEFDKPDEWTKEMAAAGFKDFICVAGDIASFDSCAAMVAEAETKAGEQLKHDELAEQFFGSYNEWMTGFEQFLQNKI